MRFITVINKGIFEKSSSNEYVRRFELRYDKNPIKLHNELKNIDPDYFKIVHLNNKKRLVRALGNTKSQKTPSKILKKYKEKTKQIEFIYCFFKLKRASYR